MSFYDASYLPRIKLLSSAVLNVVIAIKSVIYKVRIKILDFSAKIEDVKCSARYWKLNKEIGIFYDIQLEMSLKICCM